PKAVLGVPPANVLNAIKAAWDQKRRKVDVMLILDRSGSMNDADHGTPKINAARQGLSDFINLLGDSDGLGLTVFSDKADVLAPISPLGPRRQALLTQVNGIIAQGNTRLYNTISEQVQSLRALPSKHIKAIVVLTDGMDNFKSLTADQLAAQLTPAPEDKNAGEGIKVFTIAYGSDADVGGLTKIANASGGKEYAGNTSNIRQVYQLISQFF
ncbi:MAG: VWA domain-containing protein, partial [Ktedonobacteraceae bacterium]|nr:VWA domain-containing protein [Ktedonobacteraceae bacterium]